MGVNTIIIKASDYQYPTREELLEVYKNTPELHNFGFVSEHPFASLISDERSINEIYRDDHLQHWDAVLLNRNGALAHTYENAMVHFSRGVPDEIKYFGRSHYINRMQFDYYAEIFYYHFSTVKDTIAQILNVYYTIGIDTNKLYFKNMLIKIRDKFVVDALTIFFEQTKLATDYRNSFTHRTPINYPDSRSTIKLDISQLTYGSAANSFVKTSVIKANMDVTIHAMGKVLDELKVLMPQQA
ncbi:Cthe_2314 family HEPN domain-containing protein [Mucilaginibacter phyllosphaerae]